MFVPYKNSKKSCPYCGTTLRPNLWCPNSQCKSHDFAVGNRIILPSRPDYGFGYVEDILDFQTPYEFCADQDDLPETKDKDSTESDESTERDKNPSDSNLFYERPMFKVRFKLYVSKTLPAEEMRHDVFEPDENVRTKRGIGAIQHIHI